MNPPRGVTATWQKIIEMTEVPQSPGLFVLGCFARRVTIYSQQVRALNLVDALAGMGYLRRNDRIAVVGAGFSGITAAAALGQLGLAVTIFDEESNPLHLQLGCTTRFLHPHIYHWPKRRIGDDAADLPILGWKADHANKVAKEVRKAWESLLKTRSIQECFNSKIEGITPEGDGWRLSYKEKEKDKDQEGRFSLVILATGFGVEGLRPSATGPDSKSRSYWADLSLKDKVMQGKKWLVSGAGDGALTDLIQLCVRDDSQQTTLESVANAYHDKIPEAIRTRFEAKIAKGKGGEKLFEGLNADVLLAGLKLRNDAVYLAAKRKSVYGTADSVPHSSVLNRLITWALEKKGKVDIRDAKIVDSPDPFPFTDKFYHVPLQSGETIDCQDYLLRHGPVPILPDALWLGHISRQVRRLQRRWALHYREDKGADDPTLAEVPPKEAFHPNRATPSADTFSAVLLYTTANVEGEDIESMKISFGTLLKQNKVKASLQEAIGSAYQADRAQPSFIDAEQAIKDPRSFGAAVQMLCQAPLLLVHGTEVTPALSMLLGIRAAVRRGVTILFYLKSIDLGVWEELPFNLRELKIVVVSNLTDEDGFRGRLATAIEQGFRRHARGRDRYEDLPGFAALRKSGGHEEDCAPIPGDEEVLILCPFKKDFQRNWLALRTAIHDHYCKGGPGDRPAARVLDMQSPEMLSRRLYLALRRNDECVADLSSMSLNVFFELGVRLAVNSRGSRIVAAKNVSAFRSKFPQEHGAITKFLKPRRYDPTPESAGAALQLGKPWTGGTITPSYVFSIVQRCIAAEQEAGGTGFADALWDLLLSMGGADRKKQPRLPLIYPGNREIRRNTNRFIFDGLLAYVLLLPKIRSIPEARRRGNIATAELENLLRDLRLSEEEKNELELVLKSLQEPPKKELIADDLVERAHQDRNLAAQLRKDLNSNPTNRDKLLGQFEPIAKSLEVTIADLMAAAKEASEPGSLRERDLNEALAECCGGLGGLYRDLKHFDRAVEAYTKGSRAEERIRQLNGPSSSYCLVQAMVNQVLLGTGPLSANPDLLHSLEEALQKLENQKSDDRRSDLWLYADIALLTQIIKPDKAAAKWDDFEDLIPTLSAYDSTSKVVKALYTRLKPSLEPSHLVLWNDTLQLLEELPDNPPPVSPPPTTSAA